MKEKISEDEDVIQEQDIEIISESETNEDAEE
ncbi:hypothetical protein EMGBD3_01500 [Nitrosarchaeum sp.]|nr:hypothetical protein EMGBD3_01500 [Nitrosarchaeum sp.]